MSKIGSLAKPDEMNHCLGQSGLFVLHRMLVALNLCGFVGNRIDFRSMVLPADDDSLMIHKYEYVLIVDNFFWKDDFFYKQWINSGLNAKKLNGSDIFDCQIKNVEHVQGNIDFSHLDGIFGL